MMRAQHRSQRPSAQANGSAAPLEQREQGGMLSPAAGAVQDSGSRESAERAQQERG